MCMEHFTPGLMVSTLYALSVLTTFLWGRWCFYPHYTIEKTGVES